MDAPHTGRCGVLYFYTTLFVFYFIFYLGSFWNFHQFGRHCVHYCVLLGSNAHFFVPCIRSEYSPKLSVNYTDTIYRKFIATFVWRSTGAEDRWE